MGDFDILSNSKHTISNFIAHALISILSNILYTIHNWLDPGPIMQVTVKLLVKLNVEP